MTTQDDIATQYEIDSYKYSCTIIQGPITIYNKIERDNSFGKTTSVSGLINCNTAAFKIFFNCYDGNLIEYLMYWKKEVEKTPSLADTVFHAKFKFHMKAGAQGLNGKTLYTPNFYLKVLSEITINTQFRNVLNINSSKSTSDNDVVSGDSDEVVEYDIPKQSNPIHNDIDIPF